MASSGAHTELVLAGLLFSVAVLVTAARVLAVPYPIFLVLGGLAMGAIPGIPNPELEPDLVLLIFLPPLLYSASFFTGLRELRENVRQISMLAIGLVLATALAVALVAHAVIDDMSWPAAFVLGAIVSPTDPVSAIATFERVGVTDRVATLVEGESMINDAVALVSYKVALAAVVSGTLTASTAVDDLVVGVAGGVAIGFAIAWVMIRALRQLNDAPLAILLTVLTAYASFAIADGIGASGVLAAVTSGLYAGWRSHEIFDADLRLNAQSFWRVLVFALNAILFVLVGLQFPDILRRVGEQFSPGEIVGYGLMVSAVVVAVRLVWQFLPTGIGRLLPALGDTGGAEDWRERLLIGWTGMRGAVSLAAALAIPQAIDSGAPFPQRDLIIFLTYAVIAATLILQGLSLPMAIKLLGVEDDGSIAQRESKARLLAARAAIERIDELRAEEWVREETADRVRAMYDFRIRRFSARFDDEDDGAIDARSYQYQRLVRELLEAQRAEIIRLRNQGKINDDIMHRIERDLDLEDTRLEV
jgi:monovalent cation/hydrogen antiporter